MKLYLKPVLAFLAAVILLLASCQSEENEAKEDPNALSKNSELSQKLARVGMNDTSYDNIIDTTDCFSVRLPVQVAVNGQTVIVDNEEDFAIVEELLNGAPLASVNFTFPITLVYPDYEEVVISNQDQLVLAYSACTPNPDTGSITCLSINYPISVSVYDIDFQNPETIAIDSDFELFFFIRNLTVGQFYAINYPLSVVNSAGTTIAIAANAALLETITAAEGDCGCDNPAVLLEDLIVYIPFANETVDLTGFSVPEAMGPILYVTDRSGNANGALSLNETATNSFVTVPGSAGNDLRQGNGFTISAWFKRQNTNSNIEFERIVIAQGMGLYLGNENNPDIKGPFVAIPGSDNLYDVGWINDNLFMDTENWHHIVITYSDNLLLLYRDNVLQNIRDNVQLPASMQGLTLGGLFRGFLDDVRVYKRALNEDEIQILYELEGDTSQCLN